MEPLTSKSNKLRPSNFQPFIRSSSLIGMAIRESRVLSMTSELEIESWIWTLHSDNSFLSEQEEVLSERQSQLWLFCSMINSCMVIAFMAIARCIEVLKLTLSICSISRESLQGSTKTIIKLLRSSKKSLLKGLLPSLTRTVMPRFHKMPDKFISIKSSALFKLQVNSNLLRFPSLNQSHNRRQKKLLKSMSLRRTDHAVTLMRRRKPLSRKWSTKLNQSLKRKWFTKLNQLM